MNLKTIADHLSTIDRKKALPVLASVAVVVLFFLTFSITGNSGNLDKKLKKSREDLREITALSKRYKAVSVNSSGMEPLTGDLSSRVDAIVKRTGIAQYVSQVSSKFEGQRREELSIVIAELPLPLLVQFLKLLQDPATAVHIKYANVKPLNKDKNKLDVELTVAKVF